MRVHKRNRLCLASEDDGHRRATVMVTASVPVPPRLVWPGLACSPRRVAIVPVFPAGSSTSPPSAWSRSSSASWPLVSDSGSLRHTSGRRSRAP